MTWRVVSPICRISGNGKWVMWGVEELATTSWYILARDPSTGFMQVICDADGNPTPVANAKDAEMRCKAFAWGHLKAQRVPA